MKNNKGITMISLVITIIVLIIVTSITIYNGTAQLGIKRVNSLYADIDSISTKVAEYYLKNETLPVYDNLYVNNKQELEELFKKNGATTNITNVNDGDEYYVINLTKLDNLTLNYGDDYKDWTNTSTSDDLQNIYIINSVTHQIYFPHGVRSGDEYFFARFPDENEITAVELGEIEDEWTLNVTNITKTNIDDDNVTIVADVTLGGLKENYDLNSLEYTWTESNEESELKNITFTKFNVNNVSEENMNATLASKPLRNIEGKYYLCVKATDKNGKSNYKYSNRVLVSPVLLPSEYQKIEYIESTGTQWINTEFKATGDLKFEGIVLTNIKDKEMAVVGNLEGDAVLEIGFSSTHNRFFSWLKESVGIKPATSIYNNRLKFISEIKLSSNEKSIYLDIDAGLTSKNQNVNNLYIGQTIQLFRVCNRYPYTGRLYYLSICNENNIARRFYPCYSTTSVKDINGKQCTKETKGLYDIVEGKFYTNQGTGDDFIAGENVY